MSVKRPYFPFFMDISGANGYVIGGNRHAYQKVLRMQPYGCRLTVISERFVPELEKMEGSGEISLIRKQLGKEDFLNEPDFVIVCEAKEEEKQWIFDFCKKRRIPINTVDDIPYCSYIYPSLIAKGDLSVGISTGGASPAVTSILKEQMLELIPDHVDEILVYLESLRPGMKERFPNGKERGKVLKEIAAACFLKNGILTEEEMEDIVKKYKA